MTWTKFSERLPEEKTCEVFVLWRDGGCDVCNKEDDGSWAAWRERIIQKTNDDCALAWHPITYPELPKEPTQLDRDNEAMLDAWRSQGIDFAHATFHDIQYAYQEGWMRALRHERAEVAKELEVIAGAVPDWPALNRLRKRCGLDK